MIDLVWSFTEFRDSFEEFAPAVREAAATQRVPPPDSGDPFHWQVARAPAVPWSEFIARVFTVGSEIGEPSFAERFEDWESLTGTEAEVVARILGDLHAFIVYVAPQTSWATGNEPLPGFTQGELDDLSTRWNNAVARLRLSSGHLHFMLGRQLARLRRQAGGELAEPFTSASP